MAKDRKKLQHIHSSIADKQPTPQSLEVGEIAVNNAENQEFLSIKNSTDKVVRFSSDSQLIEWMERKEIMPYEGQVRGAVGPTGEVDDFGSYGITNEDLLNNKSNIVIKFNQVAASATTKHDVVNGAIDIYNNEVNPTEDGGVNDGAGLAIDMSRYAMIGANPEFSSVTVTHQSNLSGTTNISDGAGGDVLNITTTNVNVNNTNWNETITNKESIVTNETDTIGTLNESATTRNTVVGNEDLHVSGTTIEVHDGAASITNNSNVEETTNGNVTINTTGTSTVNISGETIENLVGKLTVNADNGVEINSCTDFAINTNNYKVKQCVGESGLAEFDFCGGYKINTDKMEIEQCGDGVITITEKTTKFAGEDLSIRESGATDFSGETLNVTTNGDSSFEVNGNLSEVVSGTTTRDYSDAVTENTTGVKTENNSADYIVNTTGDTTINSNGSIGINAGENTCIIASEIAAFKGTEKTNIGKDCADGGQTPLLNINGDVINETGTTMNFSGSSVNVDATNYDLDATNVCISAATKADFYGKTTNIGVDCGGATADTIYISGGTIYEGGTTNYNNFTTINNTATTINNKTTNFNITGETYVSGDVTIGGDLIIPIPCNSITSTTVNDALCEVFDRGEVSWKVGDYAATDENLKWYELWQNGAQIKDQNGNAVRIDIPKDHILKDVSIVYGKVNGSSFTACTSTATDCHWYIKLVWNVFNPSTGHSNDKTVYLPVDDFIKDIDDKNPTDVETAANHNVVIDVWYDGKQNWVSASTTPTMHVTNMYATNAVSGATVSGTSTSAGTLTVTGNATLKGTTATTLYASTSAASPTISGTNITASSAIRANNVSANTISAASSVNTANLYASGTVSGATVSGTNVNGGTISGTTVKGVSISGTNITASAAIRANNVSADTISAATHVKSATVSGTSVYSPTISGTNITASAAIRANNVSANTLTAATSVTTKDLSVTGNETVGGTLNVSGASTINGVLTIPSGISKKLTWAGGTFTADTTGYNGSSDKTITVPTAISHLPTRGKLSITHNGLSDTYDPASDKSMTLPHSALTINFGVATGQTNTSYNTSAGKIITIPTATSHLSRAALTIDYNADVRSKSDTSYDTTAAATVSIPGSLDHLSNYDGTNINIGHPTKINGNVTVTGTVTASGAIYSSDRNLKEHIVDIPEQDIDKVGFVSYKTYNFKGEDNKMYGIIAQDLQEVGLGELVYSREDGTLAVDYTSLMILQLARLKRDNEYMLNVIASLSEKIKKLEGDKED